MSATEHAFGGPWTLIKLGVLKKYLAAFSTALKNQHFRLVYIDAFAGTGQFTPRSGESEQMGSARIALSTEGFDRYCFIEQHARRFQRLEHLVGEHPDKDIHLFKGDANEIIPKLVGTLNPNEWRGVVFLDPYGLNLNWATLQQIAKTEILDLWYLFSLSGLYRQAALDLSAVDEHKAAALDRTLGTDEWRQAFYREDPQQDLFDDPKVKRFAQVDALEDYVLSRLKTEFPKVMKPLRLPMEGAPMYSLFFAVSNSNGRAIGLAQRLAKHILDSVQGRSVG